MGDARAPLPAHLIALYAYASLYPEAVERAMLKSSNELCCAESYIEAALGGGPAVAPLHAFARAYHAWARSARGRVCAARGVFELLATDDRRGGDHFALYLRLFLAHRAGYALEAAYGDVALTALALTLLGEWVTQAVTTRF